MKTAQEIIELAKQEEQARDDARKKRLEQEKQYKKRQDAEQTKNIDIYLAAIEQEIIKDAKRYNDYGVSTSQGFIFYNVTDLGEKTRKLLNSRLLELGYAVKETQPVFHSAYEGRSDEGSGHPAYTSYSIQITWKHKNA